MDSKDEGAEHPRRRLNPAPEAFSDMEILLDDVRRAAREVGAA